MEIPIFICTEFSPKIELLNIIINLIPLVVTECLLLCVDAVFLFIYIYNRYSVYELMS